MFKWFPVFLLLIPVSVFSQVKPGKKLSPRSGQVVSRDTTSVSGRAAAAVVNDTIATIDMYKVITLDRDTTYIDTSLTIKKDYEANYLRKDNFGLLKFPNPGQTYTTLDYGLTEYNPYPQFGFRAKHFAYLQVDDIKYYKVATPFSDLFYKSVLEQGQILDATISLNTSENLNFTVAYKGLHSLGKYINSLSSNGNFRFITSYTTKDKRYDLKLHITAQDFSNGENGGIINPDLFEGGSTEFKKREALNVYLTDAKSVLKGNRYFVDHTFRLSKENPNSIVLHHQFTYENEFFEFTEPTVSARFGRSYTTSINNKTRYNRMYNKIGAAYANDKIGTLEFYLEDFNYNYYYKSVIIDNSENGHNIPNSINDRIDSYGARYTYNRDKLKGSILLSNSITNQSLADIEASARYKFDDENQLSFQYQNMNKLPNHNFNLYQSDYVAYNWKHNYNNEKINHFEAEAKTKWLTAAVNYTILDDYLYFDRIPTDLPTDDRHVDTLLVKPNQYDKTIKYFSLKLGREFKVWKLALDNTVLYQKVTQDSAKLNVPEFTTRNTLYYSDHFFKKALYLQAGVTFQYFTKYYMDGYNPLLGEFYIQEDRKFGGYPLMDFFINAKIRQFRLFLKAEHFNSGFGDYNYYSAPNYPYKDFAFRIGIIWDFFS